MTTPQDTVAATAAWLDGLAAGAAAQSNWLAGVAAGAAQTAAALRAIPWDTAPLPTVTLAGPGDITPSTTAATDASATLTLSATSDLDVAADWALSGATPGDFLGDTSGRAVVAAGDLSEPIPLRVAPLKLAADRAPVTLALANIVGAAPPFPPPAHFTLRKNAAPAPRTFSGMTPNNSDMAVDQAGAVGAWRGAPLTCYTVFNWGHKGWDAFQASYTKPGWAPARIIPILAQKRIVPVCTIPGIVVGATWAEAVAGKYDAYHTACAKFIAAQHFQTTVVIRLSRESNDPDQPFYYGATPAARALFKRGQARIMRIYRDIIGADKVKYSFCVMKRAANWQDAYDKNEVDIMDIDAYMNTPIIKTHADYDKDWGQNVQPHIDVAVRDGKPVAFSEWAIKAVEMPLGIQRRYQSFIDLAKAGVLHHENYFNSTPNHALFGATKFPQSAAMYVKCYSGRG